VTGLASIVTPTMPGREELLIGRCAPSVRRLNWPGGVQHVIASDPNPALRARVGELPGALFVEINDSWRDGIRERSVGAVPWHIGSMLALGEWIGFCGDDDELLPDHVIRHVAAMQRRGADFTVSPVEFRVRGEHVRIIGDALEHGHLDADGIMCRASALRVANWTATGEDAADYRIVRDWLTAGLVGVLVGGGPTAIHHDGWAARG
jgi:hypothetical protein